MSITIESIAFSDANSTLDRIKNTGHVLVNAMAETCPACQSFKENLPPLVSLAKSKNIQVINLKTEQENEEFFKLYQCETLPYTFVFANGQFVGGDSFDKDSFSHLLNALGEVNEPTQQG